MYGVAKGKTNRKMRLVTCLLLLSSLLALPAPSADAVTYGDDVVSPSTAAPWVVPIYWGPINRKSQQICTGSLIEQQYVLTAAHCISDLEDGTFSVQVGGDRLGQGRRIYADGWWLNGRYSQRRYVNDIGILHLVEPANISPLATPSRSRKVPAKMRIYGWGLDQNGRQSGNLMYANLNRQIKTAKRAFGPLFKKRLMVAAGRKIKREGVYAGGCNGDSGGPLVNRTSNTIVGITAFGTRDCDVSAPTIFTKVGYYGKDIARGKQASLRMAQTDNQAPPRPTAPPSITGTVAAGGTVTCNPGTWLGVPKRFEFEWTIDTHDLDTTTPTLALDEDWAGRTVTCTVTAVGSLGRTGKSSVSAAISTAGNPEPGNTNPTVSWSSPANGTTITKDTSLVATTSAAGSADVTKACLTINGDIPAQNYAYSGDLTYGSYNSGTGCWTNNYGMGTLTLRIDTTPWTNGNYTFAWTVTDNNNRTSTTASRTFAK